MNNNFFTIKHWLLRIRFALNGIYTSFQTEQTIWLHLFATIVVATLSIIKKVAGIEAIAIVFAAGFVWAAELFNTAIEKLADKVTTEYDEQVKAVKDIAAGAVLIISIVALTTGLIVFIPKFI